MLIIILKILFLVISIIELSIMVTSGGMPLSYRFFIRYKLYKQIDKIFTNHCKDFKYLFIKEIDLRFQRNYSIVDRGGLNIYVEYENIIITEKNNWNNLSINVNLFGKIKNEFKIIESIKNMELYHINYNQDYSERLIKLTRDNKLKKLGI